MHQMNVGGIESYQFIIVFGTLHVRARKRVACKAERKRDLR